MPLSAEPTHLSRLADKLRAKILTLALQGKLTRGNHHWKTIRLGDYVRIRTGHKDANAATPNGQYPFFTCAKDPSRIDIWAYDCECVLVSGNCNPHVSYYNGKFNAYQRLYVIESLDHSKLSVRFLYHFFKHHMTFATEKQRGTAEKYFRLKDLTDIELGLPPLSEQEEIVGKVEALLAEVDHIREAEKIISLCASRLRASILQNALQGKLTRGNHHWIQSTLGEVFTHNTGKALNGSDKDGTLMTYITTSNLYWNEFRLENLKQMRFTESELEKCTVRRGDLLVCEGGDIGRAAIWDSDEPMRIQNHIHRLRPKGECCVKFFYYVFRHLKDNGLIGGKGIGIQGLSSKALDKIEISYPPSLAEQEEIVKKVEALLAEVDHLTSK